MMPEDGTSESKEVPVAWEALEDAFENNAPEVHSFLNLSSGEVIRVVDGVADPAMHAKLVQDTAYLRVDAVSSREQYRWMERFIANVEDLDLRHQLVGAIDGKGAFRRFKDVLVRYPVEREQWFSFRSERLRACMDAWLEAHEIVAVPRPQWEVPPVADIRDTVDKVVVKRRPAAGEPERERLHEVVDLLPARELESALAFLEFLRERRRMPRSRAKSRRSTGDMQVVDLQAAAAEDGAARGEP